ncbi:MAG TPA: HAMP domain-containing sensor histidine kinase [Methylomirabilota bacterium]|nr:HAMP domain-containing sensor histidine kinase [Methylomirabilota bacterium]
MRNGPTSAADEARERFREAADVGHIRRLVRLRWIGIAAVAVTIVYSSLVGIVDDSVALWAVVAVMVAVNAAVRGLVARRALPSRHAHRLLVGHLAFDVVAVTALAHFAGGLQNPFTFVYVLLGLVAGMTCYRLEAWALASGAFVLAAVTTVAEQIGWIHHHAQPVQAAFERWHSTPHVLGFLGVLAAMLLGTAAWATTTKERLEQQALTERALRERLEQQERLALIGEVVAGVVHELSTPLNGVRNSFRALRRDPAGFLKHADILDLMEDALERMAAISRRLLMLSREPQIERRPLRVDDVVARALAHLHPRIPSSGVTLERRLDVVPPVLADEVALSEVVTNLVTNALDAVHGGGRVVVETSTHGAAVELRVADTGPGIPPAIRARLFEPFRSTKPLGKGTGLGLAICKRLVDAHGGTISVDSRDGTGTTVVVRLPLDGGTGA